MVDLIEDQSPKVRSAAAYFLMRVIEHQPSLVFQSQETFSSFINKILSHINDH
jgi:hypothetical protein